MATSKDNKDNKALSTSSKGEKQSSKEQTTIEMDEGTDKQSLIKRYPLTFTLIGLLIVVGLWGYFNGKLTERRLTQAHKAEMVSLHKAHAEQIGKLFSWSIRSEITRNNMEQAEQYMLSLVREPNIEKVTFVDAKTKTIVYSTNKAEEGNTIDDSNLFNINQTEVTTRTNGTTIISPVMGIDRKLGILIIETL